MARVFQSLGQILCGEQGERRPICVFFRTLGCQNLTLIDWFLQIADAFAQEITLIFITRSGLTVSGQ